MWLDFSANVHFRFAVRGDRPARQSGAKCQIGPNVPEVAERWGEVRRFVRDVAVLVVGGVIGGVILNYAVPQVFGLSVPVWGWTALGGASIGVLAILAYNRFGRGRRELGRWACGCATDRPGDNLCGRCSDHCQCRFDELGPQPRTPTP